MGQSEKFQFVTGEEENAKVKPSGSLISVNVVDKLVTAVTL